MLPLAAVINITYLRMQLSSTSHTTIIRCHQHILPKAVVINITCRHKQLSSLMGDNTFGFHYGVYCMSHISCNHELSNHYNQWLGFDSQRAYFGCPKCLWLSMKRCLYINKCLPGTVKPTFFVKIAQSHLQQANRWNHNRKLKYWPYWISLLFFMRTRELNY